MGSNEIISIFVYERQISMCHMLSNGADGVIKPIRCWTRSAENKKFIPAYSEMAKQLDRAYTIINSIGKDESGKPVNPTGEAFRQVAELFVLPVSSKPPIALEALAEALLINEVLDISEFAEWPKIRAELERTDNLSVRAMAFLQGIQELSEPEGDNYRFKYLSIPVATEEEDLSFALG